MADTKKGKTEPTTVAEDESTEFTPPAPEIVDPADTKVEADKKAKAENKPTGSAEKVEKKTEAQYVMVRNVKHDGNLYEVGQAVELDGEIKDLFLKNGFCKRT